MSAAAALRLEATRVAVAPRTEAALSPLAVCLFAVYLVVYILPLPLPLQPDFYLLDPSWQIELTKAFLQGSQFGRDIVYTYGPWGFLEYARGDGAIYPWLVCGRLLIGSAFVFGLSAVAHRGIKKAFPRMVFAGLIATLADPVYVLPLVLLLVYFSYRRTALLHLVAIACALTVWIKFTSFVTVGALAAVIAIDELRRRRFPFIAVEVFATALAFWLTARQSLSGLGPFLHGAISTAVSYSSEMFTYGPPLDALIAIALLGAVAVPCLLWLAHRKELRLLPAAVWVSLLFFLQFKEAFVRNDSFHIWMGIVNALIPAAFLLLCDIGVFNDAREPGFTLNASRSCTFVAVCLSMYLLVFEMNSLGFQERIRFLAFDTIGYQKLLSGMGPSAQVREQFAAFRKAKPLPRISGTVDLVPDYQAMLYGNDLQVALPPVPQAFAAYNSYLSGMNANFYRSARRPDHIFFDVLPIDERYPTASDALSWQAYLDCYTPQSEAAGYLLLSSSGCKGAKLQFISRIETQLGREITVPHESGYGTWIEFDTSMGVAAKLGAMIAKPPLLQMSVATASGERRFRTSAEAGRTGFLLSPLIDSRKAFARLYDSDSDDVAQRMRIAELPVSPLHFAPQISVRFYRLKLPRTSTE